MASKYVVSLEVDQTGAVTNIDKVGKQLENATEEAQSLRQQLKEMQKQLQNLDANSDEFQKLSKAAGELKDRIKDAAEAVNRNAGSSFERLSANAGNLKESLVNLDFEQVGSSLKGLGQTVGGIKFSEIKSGIKDISSGFASLGKALLTNPFFLLVTGVTLLVANFDTLKSAIDGVTDAQIEAGKAAQANADAAKAQYENIAATENSLRVQGKTEAEILELKKQQLDVAIEQQKAAIEQQKTILETQIQAAERNKSIVVGILNFITAPITAILRGVDQIASFVGKDLGLVEAFGNVKDSLAGQIFDPEEVKAEGQKTIDEANKKLAELQNTRDGFTLQERAKAQAAAKERADLRKKEADELIQSQKEVGDIVAQLMEEQAKEELEIERKRLDALVKANEERIKQEDAQFAARQALITDETEKEIDAVVAKYDELFAAANGNAELEQDLARAQAEELKAIRMKSVDEEIKNQERLTQAKIGLASDGFSALAALNDSFTAKNEKQARRQFNINKALQIAQALITTYQSATAAYASQLTIPSPDAPIRAAIAAGAAVVAGLAQVNKIRQTQFDSSGGGGAAAAGGGGSASVSTAAQTSGGGAPQFNPVNTSFTGNRPAQVAKTFVLASEVYNGLQAKQKVEDQARL